MELIIDSAGLDDLIARVELAAGQVQALIVQASQLAAEEVQQQLQDGAPHGASGGPNPEGDSSGPLADSFYTHQDAIGDADATISVLTLQPAKLQYVTQGTGIFGPRGQRIYPVTKQALYWANADHPVRSIAGQQPNDFVTPITDGAGNNAEDYLQPVIDDLTAILEGA